MCLHSRTERIVSWTLAILFLAQTFGERLANWIGTYKHAGLLLLGAGMALFATLQLLRRAFVNFDFRRFTTRLGRWRTATLRDALLIFRLFA